MQLISKQNISRLAKFILTKINSAEDFDSAFIMSSIFVEYQKQNQMKLLSQANFDADELADNYFNLCVYATRHAEKILNSNLRLIVS